MFHMFNETDGEFIDVEDVSIAHEDHEDALVEFTTLPSGQVQIMFNLDIVRIHSLSDGDVVVTLKK